MADALPVKVTRKLYRGQRRRWLHVFTEADGSPRDLTGYTFRAQFRGDLNRQGEVLASSVCTVGGVDNNEVTEFLSSDEADGLPGQDDQAEKPTVYWDLESTDPDGERDTWLYAYCPVLGDVSNG